MATGLYSGVSGLALGVGLNKGVTGLWSGASGLITGWGGGFSPLSLFAASEPGAWYDPSDLSTMFQDTAGTTPVTAAGQTVGLVLDKSKGLVLGPELVTNGDFSSGFGTGWTNASAGTGTATITSGRLQITTTDTSNRGGATQSFATIIGRFYSVVWTAGGASIGNGQFRVGTSSLAGDIGIYVASAQRVVFVATATTTFVSMTTNAAATTDLFFDNISVKELPGNHATQATAASRPIYGIEPFGGRRNLLTFTERFDNAAWVKNELGATANAGVAPDGATTADRLTPNAGLVTPFIFQAVTTTASAFTVSFYAKADGYSFVQLSDGVSITDYCNFDLSTGAVVASSGYTGSIINAGNGWYRCVATKTFTAASTEIRVEPLATNLASRRPNYTANGTSGILIWGAQLELGSTATAYQRVTDQWNVTQAGVPSVSYLAFDGTDDFLLTGTITPGIDKAQVFAGVRKLSDAAVGVVVESSVDYFTNNGTLIVGAPSANASPSYSWNVRGTLATNIVSTGYPAPITNVMTGLADISGDTQTLRLNGAVAGINTADKGSGNFLAYPLYIGRRGGTTLPFNGRLYGLAVRFGANLSAAQIAQMEAWMAGKTGIYTIEQLIRLNTLSAAGVSYNAYAAADSNSNNYLVTNTVLAANGTPYTVL